MNQIERIKYYEKLLNEGEEIINNLTKDIEIFEKFKSKKEELDKYYSSEERMKDVNDDENQKLPKDLNRGVLGEDYLYDFLMFYDQFENILDKDK